MQEINTLVGIKTVILFDCVGWKSGEASEEPGKATAATQIGTAAWHVHDQGSDGPQEGRWISSNTARCEY